MKGERFEIYTDGGANPNPGPGGWAAIVVDQTGKRHEFSGAELATTNNRMELQAAIEGLARTPVAARIQVFTDSRYLRQGITEWLMKWIRNGWRRGDEPVKNADLWKSLHVLNSERRVDWHWLKGHAGHPLNERADALASERIRELKSSTAVASVGPAEPPPATACWAAVKVRAAGGRGAWAVCLMRGASLGDDESGLDETQQQILAASVRGASANRLELLAGIALLEATLSSKDEISRDSIDRRAGIAVCAGDYLRRGASEWMPDWRIRGWRTAAGEEVSNGDLWRRLEKLLAGRRIHWQPAIKTGPVAARLKLALEEAWRNQ